MNFIRAALIFSSLLLTAWAQKAVLSVDPRAALVCQGETVSFRCRVVSGSQPVQLEWKRTNNQPLADNVKVGPDGSVLTIAFARLSNQGQYRCIAINAQGKTTITASLTIKQPPKVRVKPSSPVTVRVGGAVSLECQASGRLRPSITWLKEEAGRETTLVSTRDTSAVLQVVVSSSAHAGTYVCRAQSKEGSAEQRVELRLADGTVAPKATVRQADMTAVEGQTVTMHCQASGFPTPGISWSKLRAPLPWQHREEGGTLTLTNVGRQDSGQYICNATNSAGYSEDYVQLEVDTPPYATTVPDQVTARRGDSLRLQCIAHGSHPISFHWSRVGGAAMSSGAKTKDSVLLIGQLKVSDSGMYKCVASNHIGSSEALAMVSVKV
ncbi:basement membrane-specific heparan sulfate proteoglycan core protein-like [Electrophorus electricus]|uniref:basement membrane-specific heparan sulfate proteoglycan core protein-like n=1 Tax=Electrophorus electricus TaxID=8005 RepID=UPI0015D0BAE7|nr:basement membrane-specific heparan sulfate proteoglycan core protein-like [Electrophorus electricus]